MESRRTSFIALARSITLAALLILLSSAALPAHSAASTVNLIIWQVADGNQRFTISGTVEAVDYACNSVRINAGGQHVEILVTPTTAVEVHGESGSIADIRKGVKISASGVVRNGDKIALSIVLK
jgi:multidrug efflux pump subunit AcrA (membrane-fusion protein)